MSQTIAAPYQTLPPAPAAVVRADGQPACGRYAGATGAIDWTRLAPPHARGALWRRLHHKRWQYVALATADLFCGVAMVDLGWTGTMFAYAFDRRRGAQAAGFSQESLPGLGAAIGAHAGAASRFDFAGKHAAWQPQDGGYRLTVRGKDLQIDAELDARAAAPLLLAVGPVAGGAVHATQKSSGMPLRGVVRAGGTEYRLDGGIGSFDYSNGLLARDTQWRWASAHALDLGFNLQAGYFGTQENALWCDGELVGLGAAEFIYDAHDPLAPWQVRTDDGLLDLRFTPEGARRENKDLLIAASHYVQPIGSFSGWVRPHASMPARKVERLAGVTEDHRARW